MYQLENIKRNAMFLQSKSERWKQFALTKQWDVQPFQYKSGDAANGFAIAEDKNQKKTLSKRLSNTVLCVTVDGYYFSYLKTGNPEKL